MKEKIITLVILLALFAGGKSYLESEGERTVRVAQEMYEDKKYDKALDTLRSKERWLGWTVAFQESEELRKKIRRRMVAKQQRTADEAEARRLDAEWKTEQKEIERQEKEEEYRKQMDDDLKRSRRD